ncbi:hypothetical protein PsYK624_146650 [Phanerochaete sordida]|uniref:Fungal-type protein kinase domain-containing protein n=1 Tax=Phanerochaete sordida TaxID=48140 RepID=A0A9P3GN21_9APHY|nr:hypothetical protein PsYK624_146650 [Phanerochaete sordida]
MVIDLDGEVQLVPDDFFFDGLLPAFPGRTTAEGTKKILIKQGKINRNGDGWTAWPTTPSHCTETENAVFSRFAQLIKDIKCARNPNNPATLHFLCEPDKAPVSTTSPSTSKPDAFGIRDSSKESTSDDAWIDITIPGEFKKGGDEKGANDNAVKILWSMDHIMREDPRRRFVYGFTVENNKMRMWFVSRSEAFASYEFDWLKAPEKVIKFFFPLLFASEQELGWDSTITRRSPPKVSGPLIQYDIEVGDVVYRTQRLISDAGAQLLRGRGTRVWEVRKLENGEEVGPSLVLKDAWPDEGRESERDISEKIHKSGGHQEQATFEKYFVSVEHDAEVPVTIKDRKGTRKVPDHTYRIMRRGRVPVGVERLPVSIDPSRTKLGPKSAPVPTGVSALPLFDPTAPPQYYPKVHRRTIIAEVAYKIEDAAHVSEAFLCLVDVVEGLRALHKNGWVHRDISVGNILVHKFDGKLSDVEYAKHKTDSTQHSIRTGTPYFMSTEVELGHYNFLPMAVSSTKEDKYESSQALKARNAAAREAGSSTTNLPTQAAPPPPIISAQTEPAVVSKPPFRYNFLHDMESTFWVAVWMLICVRFFRNDTSLSEGEWTAYMNRHAVIANNIFDTPGARLAILSSGTAFMSYFDGALPQVVTLAEKLCDYRELIFQAFFKAESTPGHVAVDFDNELYDKASTILLKISTAVTNKNLYIRQPEPEKPRKQLKRVQIRSVDKNGDDKEQATRTRKRKTLISFQDDSRRQTLRSAKALTTG